MIGLNFEDEELAVDWISFKFEDSNSVFEKQLGNYFLKLGFNCFRKNLKSQNSILEPIYVNKENKFKVCFKINIKSWGGLLVELSGKNGQHFYQLLKDKKIDETFFQQATLGRFDIHFDTQIENQSADLKNFFQDCKKKSNVSYQKNAKGIILKNGSRRSSVNSRIYAKNETLRFELEVRRATFFPKVSDLFSQNNLKEFEHKFTQYFIKYFSKIIPMTSVYSSWLAVKLRSNQRSDFNLKFDYMTNDSDKKIDIINKKSVVMLLQFLNYAKNLKFTPNWLGKGRYRCYEFLIQDFLKSQKLNSNHYQINKLIQFFVSLQENLIITQQFSKEVFRSLVTIPRVEVEKVNNIWLARVWVADEIFDYRYPFHTPDIFHGKLNKHQFAVRYEIIKTFSATPTFKHFFIKNFFLNYPSSITNKQKCEIKKDFIEVLNQLQSNQIIESNIKIIPQKSMPFVTDINKLTTLDLSNEFIIYEKLKTN